MDKSKGKDLRAAGKKRLEEFQQRKNKQKGISNKSAGTALRALAAEDTPLSDLPPENDDVVQNSKGKVPTPTPEVSEGGVGSPGQGFSDQSDLSSLQERNLASPMLQEEDRVWAEPVRRLAWAELEECASHSGLATPSISQTIHGVGTENGSESLPEETSIALEFLNNDHLNKVGAEYVVSDRTANRLQTSPSNNSGVQVPVENNNDQDMLSKVEALEKQLKKLTEEKEMVSKELFVKAELQLKDESKLSSLYAEVELVKQQLSLSQNENVQMAKDFSLCQMEVTRNNQQFALEVKEMEQRAIAAENRILILSGELEMAKLECVDTNNRFGKQVEILQKELLDVVVKCAEMGTELSTSNKLVQGLQHEKDALTNELRKFDDELRRQGEEKLRIVNDLEALTQSLQTLEVELDFERRTLRHEQELGFEMSKREEHERNAKDVLQGVLLAKDLELEDLKDKVQKLESRAAEQAAQVEECQQYLYQARRMEEQLLVQYGECQEQISTLHVDKVELINNLAKEKLVSKALAEEKSKSAATFDVELEQHRDEVKKKGEENLKLEIQLETLRQETKKLEDLLVEYKSITDCRTEEMSKVVQELDAAKEQIVLLTGEKEQLAARLGNELLECKELLRNRFEENSSLLTSLEDSKSLIAELKKHEGISDGLQAEKSALETEILHLQRQWQLTQEQSAAERELELQKSKTYLLDLEEDRSSISAQLEVSIAELSAVRAKHAAVEDELLSFREQIANIENQNSTLVKILSASQNDLQQLREENLSYASDLVTESEKHAMLWSEMQEDKNNLLSQLEESSEWRQALQKELVELGKSHSSDISKQAEVYKELEEKHTNLLTALLTSQDEISKLMEEKRLTEIELERIREEWTRSEAVNKDLIVALDQQRAHQDVIIQEKTVLLNSHSSEFKEMVRVMEESNGKLNTQVEQLSHDLNTLNKEKYELGLELEALKNQHQEMEVDHRTLESEYCACKDQFQVLITEKGLIESKLASELEESRKQTLKAKEVSAQQITELEANIEHLQRMNESKFEEIEKLQDQVQKLVQFQHEAHKDLAKMKSMEEFYGNLVQAQDDAESREAALHLQMKTLEESLNRAMNENSDLASSLKHLEAQRDLEDVEIRKLQDQLKVMGANLANLESEKDFAVQKCLVLETELNQSRDRLSSLEESVSMIRIERDDIAGQLVSLSQIHDNLVVSSSEDAQGTLKLKEMVGALEAELADVCSELENQRQITSEFDSRMGAFGLELENAIGKVLPEVGQELLTLPYKKSSAEYWTALASRMLTENRSVQDELHRVRFECYQASNKLSQADEMSIALRNDRDMAVEHMTTQLEKATGEIDVLQDCLRKLECVAAEKQEHVDKLEEHSQKLNIQLAKETLEKGSFQVEILALQRKIAEQEADILNESTMSSRLQGEIKSIVLKLLSGAWIDPATIDKDLLLSDPWPCGQLETAITLLQKGLDEGIVQIEDFRERIVVLSTETEHTIEKLKEENVALRDNLQDFQDKLTMRDREMESLTKRVEENASIMAPQVDETESLLQVQELLAIANTEKEALLSSLTQADQKLSVTREKLSLAVSKGKAVVQQRDHWKQSLLEKSKEFDLLVVAHQQDLEKKDAALFTSETRIGELTASLHEMDFQRKRFENVVGAAQGVFIESGVQLQNLCAELDGMVIPQEWDSCDLVKKVVWTVEAMDKVLQRLESLKEEVLTLEKNASTLSAIVQTSETRVAEIGANLSLLNLEKTALVSQFEDDNGNLREELNQMTLEKAQLTGIIRQLDLDVAARSQEIEELAHKLEDQAVDILRFQAEITSLQTKLSEEEEVANSGVVYCKSLEGTVDNFVRNLTDLSEIISNCEFDTFSAETPLLVCKETMKLLLSNRTLVVEKLYDILLQLTRPKHTSGQVLHDHACQILEDNMLFRASGDILTRIDEEFTKIEQQTTSSQVLLQQNANFSASLSSEREEKSRLELELTHAKQKLTLLIDSLSSAENMCKALVQQVDSLKQSLVEKNAELETSTNTHLEELKLKELEVQEKAHSLRTALDRCAGIELDLVSLQRSVHAESSLEGRLLEKDRCISEMHLKCNLAETNAELSRNSISQLSSEIQLSHKKLEDLENQVSVLKRDKENLLLQLESSSAQSSVELGGVAAERDHLLSLNKKLEDNLAIQKQEKENAMGKVQEVCHLYNELKLESEEALAKRANLYDEKELLQHTVSQLQMSLKEVAEARMRSELDAEAVLGRIHSHIGEPLLQRSSNPLTSTSHSPQSRLDLASTIFVQKYEAALQEVEELSKQRDWLTESQQKMIENSFSEQEVLEQLQQKLESREKEFNELINKMEEVSSREHKQNDFAQGLLEEVHRLREDLLKKGSEKDALQAEFVLLDQKSATTREKLGLAIKKGKGIAQQRDLLKQSLSELELRVSTTNEELKTKDLALEEARIKTLSSEEQVLKLGLKVNSLMSVVSTLENQIQESENSVKKIDLAISKFEFPSEWQLKEADEKIEWLVAAVSSTQKSLRLVGDEAKGLKAASFQLSSDLKDAKTRVELEQESQAILRLKLEESEGELKWGKQRIADLEKRLSSLGETDQETEVLSQKVIDLEAMLQQKLAEVNMAEGTVMAWVERFEESERDIRSSQEQISLLERKVQELVRAEQQVQVLSNTVASLEDSIRQKEAAVKAMDAARGQAMNRLATTIDKFRKLYQQSQGLVVELERMHGSLLEKDAEMVILKEELVNLTSQKDAEIVSLKEEFGKLTSQKDAEMVSFKEEFVNLTNQKDDEIGLKEEFEKLTIQSQVMQEALDSKNSFILQLERLLEKLVSLESGSSQQNIGEDTGKPALSVTDEEICLANVNALQKLFASLVAKSKACEAGIASRDVELHGLRKELQEHIAERTQLESNLKREQAQSQRLQSTFASAQAPVEERVINQKQEIEEVGKFLLPTSAPSPHVRSVRKPASIDVAIDVDLEKDQSLVEFDDKGHGFKSLASSNFMPRSTRAIAEQIDKFCVLGGRVLMRQPSARLGLTLYWIAIHIWMVFLISAAHV